MNNIDQNKFIKNLFFFQNVNSKRVEVILN